MIPHTTIDLIVNEFGQILDRSTKVRQVKLKRRYTAARIIIPCTEWGVRSFARFRRYEFG